MTDLSRKFWDVIVCIRYQLQLANDGIDVEYWLNVEAFEFLRDDPCLPLDPIASGMGELLNR